MYKFINKERIKFTYLKSKLEYLKVVPSNKKYFTISQNLLKNVFFS